MDPISAAGIGLSVVSLAFQAFGGCIKGYQLFIDVAGMPAEYSHLRTRLRIEQSRILNWGEQVGLVESILNRPQSGMPANYNLVLDVLWQIQAAFHSCVKVTTKFDKLVAPSPAPTKETTTTVPPAAEKKLFSRALLVEKILGAWESAGHTADKLEWAMIKKTSFETLITKLVDYNDRIIGLLDHSSLRDLHVLQTQSNLMLLQMTDEVGQLRRIVQAMQITDGKSSAYVKPAKSSNDLEHLAAFKEQTLLESHGQPRADLFIPPSQVQIVESNDQSDREYATWKGKPVWIEWRESFEGRPAFDAVNKIMQKRVQDLAALLSSGAKPKAFRAPLCVGYIRDADGDSIRYGLVYDASCYPARAGPRLISLREVISSSRTISLTQRAALAAHLAEALLYLHSVNWLHKGLRSANILFPGSGRGDAQDDLSSLDLSNPIVSGFDFSRPDFPEERTFRNQQPLEQALYLHPDLLKVTRGRSHKSHDIYSFGLIMLEIALWKPVESIAKIEVRRSQLPQLRAALLSNPEGSSIQADVADRAGEAYSAALYVCLNGGEALGIGQDDAESDPEIGALTMQTFYQDVVEPLRGLKV